MYVFFFLLVFGVGKNICDCVFLGLLHGVCNLFVSDVIIGHVCDKLMRAGTQGRDIYDENECTK